LPAWSTLLHPVAAPHTSVVHAFPSSHDAVPPPAMHCPAEHVFGNVQVNPAHEPARHCVPSVTFDHDVVPRAVSHTWHALDGFDWPFVQHVPSIRQEPPCSVLPHPPDALHASVVHVLPSSHDAIPPPTVHCPPEHDRGAVHVRPAHDPAAHCVPFDRAVHDVVAFAGVHTLHAFDGFSWPDA
jgi:hypothetical protein